MTKDVEDLNVDMQITSHDRVNELSKASKKSTIFEDPELKTEVQDSEINRGESDFNKSPLNISGKKVLYQKQENTTLKTQGTIYSRKQDNNFESFDKSKVPTNQGDKMMSHVNSNLISVDS